MHFPEEFEIFPLTRAFKFEFVFCRHSQGMMMLVKQARTQWNGNIRCTSEHNYSIAEKMCMDTRNV